jgi:hypothetical protein
MSLAAEDRGRAATGLISDYVLEADGQSPHPPAAGEQAQESDLTDSEVAYNSCRVPWHIGTDYLVSGDPRAKQAADAITDWIKRATNGDPTKIIDGYKLDGSPGSLGPGEMHGPSLAFSAPFAVAAMTDASHQAWLDALWNFTVVQDADVDQGDDYYGNTIKVIAMIILSGNYWVP